MSWFAKLFKKKPKTSEQLKQEELSRQWRRKVDKIFADAEMRETEIKKSGKKCPTCNGSGISFLAIAAGGMTCFTCGGRGKIQRK